MNMKPERTAGGACWRAVCTAGRSGAPRTVAAAEYQYKSQRCAPESASRHHGCMSPEGTKREIVRSTWSNCATSKRCDTSTIYTRAECRFTCLPKRVQLPGCVDKKQNNNLAQFRTSSATGTGSRPGSSAAGPRGFSPPDRLNSGGTVPFSGAAQCNSGIWLYHCRTAEPKWLEGVHRGSGRRACSP
jgi:hypothetical protein